MHHIELTKKGERYALSAGVKLPIGTLNRATIEARIELHLAIADALIALLDDVDEDPDLEEVGDLEPSLGGAPDDREEDRCDDEWHHGWREWHLIPANKLGGRSA